MKDALRIILVLTIFFSLAMTTRIKITDTSRIVKKTFLSKRFERIELREAFIGQTDIF